jgi:hypothetical protein
MKLEKIITLGISTIFPKSTSSFFHSSLNMLLRKKGCSVCPLQDSSPKNSTVEAKGQLAMDSSGDMKN